MIAVEAHGVILVAGLLVKVDKVDARYESFTYVLAQNSASLPADGLDWYPFSKTCLPQISPHVRYHDVHSKENDGMRFEDMICKFEAEAAVAVIVDTDESTHLATLLTVVTKIPVVVVSCRVGQKLKLILQSSGCMCKICPKPERDFPLVGQCVGAPSLKAKCIENNDYLIAVKRALFHKRRAYSPIEDVTVFQTVMSLLSIYELIPAKDREHSKKPGDLYRKLRKHIEKNHAFLKKDFVFYFILADRVLQAFMQDIYQRDDMEAVKKFFVCLINTFNMFENDEIVTVFKNFMQRGNFQVEVTTPNCAEAFAIDVFALYARACLLFASRMDAINKKMLLISMYLKMLQGMNVSKGSVGVWTIHVIQAMAGCPFNEEVIEDLKKGLECSHLLEVQESVCFNESLMADFFLGEERTRTHPFSLLRSFLKAIKPYLCEQLNFVTHILLAIRVSYQIVLCEEKYRLCELSEDTQNPELGAINEVLKFLDDVLTMWEEKKWTELEDFEDQIQKWLMFLLSLVDITQTSAVKCYKRFISGEFICCNPNQRCIRSEIIRAVGKNVKILPVHGFLPLCTELELWQTELLTIYCDDYDVEKFGLQLTQDGWNVLLKEILKRHPEAHSHAFLLGFLKSVAHWYSQKNGHGPHYFFLGLLNLEVHSLFFKEKNDLKDQSSLRSKFYVFLEQYYEHQQEQCKFAMMMKIILESVSEERDNHFQDTVLPIVAKGTAKEVLQHPNNHSQTALTIVVRTVDMSYGAFDNPSSRQAFCWTVVAELCKNLPSLQRLRIIPDDKVRVFKSIGPLHYRYCRETHNGAETTLLGKVELPEDLQNVLPQIRAYFEWVRDIHNFLSGWKDRLNERNVTHGEIKTYTGQYSKLEAILMALGSQKYIFDYQKLKSLDSEFDLKSGKISNILIRKIRDSHRTLWCTLPSILQEYGLELPSEVAQDLECFVKFPETKEYTAVDGFVSVSAEVQTQTSLRNLSDLYEGLTSFLKELEGHTLDLLVFFHLHESSLFQKYLKLKIRNELCTKPEDSNPVTVKVLISAVTKTKSLICSIIEGKAKYSDITAEGAVVLKDIDIDTEFSILEKSIPLLNIHMQSPSGLKGVKCMLELFKASTYIKRLGEIFQRYDLICCIEDENYKALDKIPQCVDDELTPITAMELLKTVKTLLQFPVNTSVDCLEFLNEIFKSKAFYEFILVRRFYGKQGHKAFRQQYELITVQLQNKASDFEEKILNHLFPAFQFLSPFVTTSDVSHKRIQPQFRELVSAMWELDIINGPTKLRNVYQNIHLVLQWFSQVQGDTAKSIETELEDVMKTGVFVLQAEGPFVLQFQRSAGVAVSDNHSHLCEWNSNEINSFVTRLSFLSSKESSREKSKRFLCISQAARKSFDLIGKIEHFKQGITITMLCSESTKNAEDQLDYLQKQFLEGRAHVSKLKKKYRWLYFIHGSLVSEVYSVLIKKMHTAGIANEILFLLPEALDVTKLELSCVRSLEVCRDKFTAQSQEFTLVTTPMEFVGCFLDAVFSNLTVGIPEMTKIPPEHHTVLHYAPSYSQDLLMKLLLQINDMNVPQRFQIFWCNETSTEDELAFFFDRVEGIRSIYTLLETNNLPLPLQEYVLQRMMKYGKQVIRIGFGKQEKEIESGVSVLHYVETKPSVLHDAFNILEHDVSGPSVTIPQVSNIFLKQETIKESSIELVCGIPGDGKSYYILNKLKWNCSSYVIIPINEGFCRQRVIERLCSLPLDPVTSGKEVFGVFFNFTLCYPKDSLNIPETIGYENLWSKIGWFFFELLVLGAVEDFKSARTFRVHKGAKWQFYIEVPPSCSVQSKSLQTTRQLEQSVFEFQECLPLFHYIGRKVMIGFMNPYSIDSEVQLVCKYLKTCKVARTPSTTRSLINVFWGTSESEKPGELDDLPADECLMLLKDHTPSHATTKVSQRLFIRYMHRRCQFLEHLQVHGISVIKEATSQLCSTLLKLMLDEVEAFTNPQIQGTWSKSIPFQIIYGVSQDGNASIGIITSSPDRIKVAQKQVLEKFQIDIPTENMLRSRDYLVQCLCSSLSIPEDVCSDILMKESYVLTLDYVLKMLSINERRLCGVPVVIEGETGVGKTALIEMLSKLWNYTHTCRIQQPKEIFVCFLKEKLKEHYDADPDMYSKALKTINSGFDVWQLEHISSIARLPLKRDQSVKFYILIKEHLLKTKNEVFWFLMKSKDPNVNFLKLLHDLEKPGTLETAVRISYAFLSSDLLDLFYRIPIHAALTPDQIGGFLKPIFNRSTVIKEKCLNANPPIDSPIFVIFLDEVNTSSCGGVLKEIIVDHSFFGENIPDNVFIVGAGNPHRGNSVTLLEAIPEVWCRGTYFVRPLHPTLRYLVWDYGALDRNEEEEYVKAKLQLVDKSLPIFQSEGKCDPYDSLTDLIVKSQDMMRDCVFHFIIDNSTGKGIDSELAENASKSCVSQRDIQRVITFYSWILRLYSKFNPYGLYAEKQEEYQRRAVLVSLGIVYYLRQPDFYRQKYEDMIKKTIIFKDIDFSQAFNDDLNWMMKHIALIMPPGIAKTKALKENLFAMIACICTRTPLIIVGEPGSSKSLSFHLVAESLRGQESISDAFKETGIFPSVDPYFHQCSRHTTSNDIVAVFERAKGRQETLVNSVEKNCVVFMDEAGLPEESRESLKALHYYLDKPSVAFVGISNHVLDAAKTNRCVSVVRMKISEEELKFLAKGCICDTPNDIPSEKRSEIESILNFCDGYATTIKEKHGHFYGLRDFVHFLHYFRRHHGTISFGKLVLRALERNFNGVLCSDEDSDEIFPEIIKNVVKGDAMALLRANSRNIIDILKESLKDSPSGDNPENAVRYKLIIDPSRDNSLIRYLFKYGVVKKDNTRMFMCSDAFSGEEAQKVVMVSTICHSVTEGYTVILSQTSDINESFYDLFNLRYRCIDDPDRGRLYYTNVAVGSYIKPCRVHPKFQCVVLIHKSEVPSIPAPFLNRFEKYHITYGNMLDAAMRKLPYGWKSLMKAVKAKVTEFAAKITASASIFGYHEETVSSLFLWFLPANPIQRVECLVDHSEKPEQYLLEILLHSLREIGFCVPHIPSDELELDVESLFQVLRSNVFFDEFVDKLDDISAISAMDDALHILNGEQCSDSSPTLSVGACLMISLTLRWTVRHLCKALMQVMTPEAVVIFHKKIPSTYLKNYLKNQEHFDLNNLIDWQYKSICNERRPGIACTKLLVFCRTSFVITNLKFNTACVKVADDSRVHLSESQVMFLSKASYHTEGWFLEKLYDFYRSDEKKCVLVIKVNMQETSVKAINHIRMLIEDAENQHCKYNKLAVVLLHFPSSMFSGGTYPSLFQAGWSHYYLDSVSLVQEPCSVNTEQWITGCCLAPALPDIGESLYSLTEQSIPTLVSLLASKLKTAFMKSYLKQNDSLARKNLFSQLLNEKGFGKLLCLKFKGYWNPPLLAAYLKKAATIIFTRESSAKMSVLIQNLICGKFSEFVIYMVSIMIESGTLHLVWDPQCPLEVLTLFKNVVSTMDLPEFSKLSQLNIIKGKATLSKKVQWLFPFYSMISKSVDEIIAECEYEAREQSLHMSEEETDSSFTLSPSEVMLTSLVETEIETMLQMKCQPMKQNRGALVAFLKQLEKNEGQMEQQIESLLDHYFCDFITDRLSVACAPGSVVFIILQEYFLKVSVTYFERTLESVPLKPSSLTNAMKKLILFHVFYRYNCHSLAQILPIIKQIDELQPLIKEIDQTSFCSPQLSECGDLLSLLSDTRRLCAYTIDSLFGFVQSVWMSDVYSTQWFSFYQKMIRNQHVKKLLYKFMEPSEEGKLNIMHTTFVMLCCDIADNELKHKGYAAFWTLCNKFFSGQELKDANCCPRLEDCTFVIFECMEMSQNSCIPFIICGLLEHFFSEHRSEYHNGDIDWLLKLSNEKVMWRCSHIRILTDNAQHGIPFGVVKHYLLRVLVHDRNQEGNNITLANFNAECRSIIGKELLRTVGSDTDVQYCPSFYAPMPQSNQPLADIYFLIVLETHIGNENLSTASLKKEIEKLQMPESSEERFLVAIEQQAFIQILFKKMIERRTGHTVDKLQINSLLIKATSSDILPFHGTVIAMHLLNHSRNLCKLRQQMEHLYKNGISCLGDMADELKKQSFKMCQEPSLLSLNGNAHLLPLYNAVCKAMKQYENTGCAEDGHYLLYEVHKRWSKASLTLEHGKISINAEDSLKMMMWLASYHHFYLKQRYFDAFIQLVEEQKFMDQKELKLFKILLGKSIQDTKRSFLKGILHPHNRNHQDETEMEMRNCVVNIVAVILGSPKGSNHLWYHVMEPGHLDGTFLTGFMYCRTVCSKEKSFYEDGTHLSKNGLFGKYTYIADGGRRGLTLPSLYILLWMNFASFGMAHLIEQSTNEGIPYICENSKHSEVRCSERLQSLWRHMTVKLDFCDEHVSYLVTNCLSSILKASCGDKFKNGGKFFEYEELKKYEEVWHGHIFDPMHSLVSQKVIAQMKQPVLSDITMMKKQFPKLLSFDDLAYMVQAMDVHQEQFKMLAQFVVEYPRLHVGSCLLPNLIRLYQWLHQEMAHSVTKETATKITLANIKKQLAEKAPEMSKEFIELHDSVIDNFIKYVSLTGRHKGVQGHQQQWLIDGNTALVDLVSGVPDGKDCIFRVIYDIIFSHRSILTCLSKMSSPLSNSLKGSIHTQLPSQELHPALLSPSDCIVNTEDISSPGIKLRMLMSKWTYYLPPTVEGRVQERMCTLFNVNQLQEDVVATYLAGKPMIEVAQHLYTSFSFASSVKENSNQELVHLQQQLPCTLKIPLSKQEQKTMEFEFHSASVEVYQSLITSLTTSLHILVNELKESSENTKSLVHQQLGAFLDSEEESENFLDIESKRCRLSQSQISYINGVELCHLSSVLEMFMKWNDAGVYDFHMLPYAMKGNMAKVNERSFLLCQTKYTDKLEFLKHLKRLEGALVQLQPQIMKAIDTAPQTPICSLLDREETVLAEHIPNSIMIYQYVALRLLIRRLMLSCQSATTFESDIDEDSDKWQENEPEPWKTYLNCEMQTVTPPVTPHSGPAVEKYGFGTKTETPIDPEEEMFECSLDSCTTNKLSGHKEYMSELDVDESSVQFPDLLVVPGKQAADFDTEDVCKFLKVIGLPQCVEWAREEEITGDDMMGTENTDLSDKNLESLGLHNSFHRLKLMVNLERLENECRHSDMALSYPPRNITIILSSMGEQYERYIQLFLDNGIDGEILYRASDQVLKDLGINSAVDRALMKHRFFVLINGPTELSEIFTPEKVHQKLMEIKLELASVAEFVMKHGIDGEVIANASDDLIKEMGIRMGQMRKLQGKLKLK